MTEVYRGKNYFRRKGIIKKILDISSDFQNNNTFWDVEDCKINIVDNTSSNNINDEYYLKIMEVSTIKNKKK